MKPILSSSIFKVPCRNALSIGFLATCAALAWLSLAGGFSLPSAQLCGEQVGAVEGADVETANSQKQAETVYLTNSTALHEPQDSGGWIEPLHALSSFSGMDSDSDGLPDRFEQVLRTDLDDRDTDGDGFEDFEERARGTNLHEATDLPTSPDPAALNLISHATAHEVMVGATMYFGSGLGGRYKIRVGVSSGGRVALLPLQYLGEISEIRDVIRTTTAGGAGYEASADLRFMEICLPRRLVDGGRHLCVFAYLIDTVTAQVVASETIDIFSTMDGGLVAEEAIDRMPLPTQGTATPLSGSLYIPLGDGNGPNDVPTTWSPLRVCLKSSTVVGTSGSLVTREVVRASCVAGYDGFCPSTCPSSVGTTYHTIDPLTFVSE